MKDNHLDNLIVRHLAGSHAYGTNNEHSDIDYRGIFMADKKFILTPFFTVGEVSDPNEEDTKYFELNKYVELYLDANPNILETLWVDESEIDFKTEMYDILRSYRSELLSKKIAFTYTGYAHNQVTRMKNHHGWMDKERTAEKRLREIFQQYPCQQVIDWMNAYFPDYVVQRIDTESAKGVYAKTIIDFDKYMRDTALQMISTIPLAQHHFVRLVHNYLPEKVLDRDFNLAKFNKGYELIHYGDGIFGVVKNENAKTIVGTGNLHWESTKERSVEEMKQQPILIVKYNKKEFEELNDNRKNYHTWKENRNEKRSVLESQNGYDTKHAMHVVRLLRTAEEALETGVVHVKRPDAAELLAIRNGAWSYDEMMQYFAEKEDHIRNVLYKKSTLPHKGDIKTAAKVLIEMREAQWYSKR